MRHARALYPTFVAILLAGAIEPPAARAQTIRSTRFDGSREARVLHARHPQYDATVPMTVEAWVYREAASRIETIVSHDRRDSWALSLSPRLRFYRSGGLYAESDRTVEAGKWTHVAASFDGAQVRFYINANSAGTRPLAHAGAGIEHGITIGADPSDLRGFLGFIDEVRIWNRALPQAAIGAAMDEEVRIAEGLAAVFPTGGPAVSIPSADGIILAGLAAAGVESSVFGVLPRDLVVPKAASTARMLMDGVVDPGEYAGAEQLVLRYPVADPSARDAVAHVVHTDTDLYVGVTGLWGPAPAEDPEDFFVSLFLDPKFTRTGSPQPEHVRVDSSMSLTTPSRWWEGDGSGGYEPCVFISPDLGPIPCEPAMSAEPGVRWQVAKSPSIEFFASAMEFRIAKGMLDERTETDGLSLIHSRWGGALDYPAPIGALGESPRSWARVTYTESSSTLLSTIEVSGTVTDVTFAGSADLGFPGAEPVEGHKVFLNYGGSSDETTTDAEGRFRFSVSALPGMHFTLQLDTCCYRPPGGGPCTESCRSEATAVFLTGVHPTSVSDSRVEFPGCEGDACVYAGIGFHILRPPPPVAVTSVEPVEVNPGLLLRDLPTKQVEAPIVTVHGSNLHRYIQIHVQPQWCEVPPPTDCLDSVRPVEITEWADDGSFIRIRMPGVDSYAPGESWKVVVHDPWVRGDYRRWTAAPVLVRYSEPPFPLVHGFGFENERFEPMFRHLLATYGRNAYFCAGIRGRDGRCFGCLVPRPSYFAYRFVYLPWIAASDGSCVGMAATSLLLANGDLDAEEFDPRVNYAGGFTDRGPVHFDLDPCGTVDPVTLAAVVEANHGVQTSFEYIFEVIHQATSSTSFADGDPRLVLADIREHLGERILCMRDGGGHCVTPWKVEDLDDTTSRIWVYDNNYPCTGTVPSPAELCYSCPVTVVSPADTCVTNRFVDIDRERNQFTFLHDVGGAETWTGTRIYSMPLSLFRNERHAPFDPRVLARLPAEIYRILVSGVILFAFGGADGLYTNPEGGRWGREADGTFVERMPGAVPLFPMTGAAEETRQIPVFIDQPGPIVDVELSGRGGECGLFATRGGHLASLQVSGLRDGDADFARIESDTEERLEALSYSSSRGGTSVLPTLGVVFDEREEAVFRWSAIPVGAGGEATFRLLRKERGVEFHNRTGESSRHTVAVEFAVDGTEGWGLSVFGPFEMPNGATHRITVAEWPSKMSLSQLDFDSDGTFDQTTTASARSCSLPAQDFEDCNRNGVADACDLDLGVSADRNLNAVPDECEPTPANFALEVEEADVAACGRLSIRLDAPEPVAGFQLGLEWDPAGPVEFARIVPGRAWPEGEVQVFHPRIGGEGRDLEPGRATVGLLLSPGVTIGPGADLEVLEVQLRAVPGAFPGSFTSICVVDGLGDPAINAVVTVLRGGNSASVRPERGCGAAFIGGDDSPPFIACPADIEVEGGPNGAIVEWAARAEDECGEIQAICNPPSGSAFPIGTTEVTCTAVDASGNTAECRFRVTVKLREGTFKRADGNSDGAADISDALAILNYLFLGGEPLTCLDAADANDDDSVDISDATTVLNFLFLGGRAPPPPGPYVCGPDLTPSGLGECVSIGCQ